MEIDDKEGMVITVHDITRLKKAEVELHKAREKAENALYLQLLPCYKRAATYVIK